MKLVIAASLALPLLWPAFAASAPVPDVSALRTPEGQAIAAAAEFIATAQADLLAPDRRLLVRATWPFEQGSEVAAPDRAGVAARALLAAYRRTGDVRSLEAARLWARARANEIAREQPVYDCDIETLGAIALALGEERYLAAARTAFDRRHGAESGRVIVERLFWARKGTPALVGLDAAMTLRAARAVGSDDKAREIALALADTAKRWNVGKPAALPMTSRAAVLEALPRGMHARIDKLVADLRRQVILSQGPDGSWGRNVQATAYSVRALLASGDADSLKAADRGLRSLRTSQLKTGGWRTVDGYLLDPQETVYAVTAEALLALAGRDRLPSAPNPAATRERN